MNSKTANKKLIIKTMAITGIMAALASILRFLEFPLVFIAPDFLKIDLSNLPALIVSFIAGPVYGLIIAAIKNLVYLPFSATGGIGEIADFILGGIFVFAAGIIYKLKPTKKSALAGMISGTLIATVTAAFLNYYLLIPLYSKFIPLDAIIAKCSEITPWIKDKFDVICFTIIPFNLIKYIMISLITFLVYKRLSNIFKKI